MDEFEAREFYEFTIFKNHQTIYFDGFREKMKSLESKKPL
jgi:hypothetical protein